VTTSGFGLQRRRQRAHGAELMGQDVSPPHVATVLGLIVPAVRFSPTFLLSPDLQAGNNALQNEYFSCCFVWFRGSFFFFS
jgi:hypothetical protein